MGRVLYFERIRWEVEVVEVDEGIEHSVGYEYSYLDVAMEIDGFVVREERGTEIDIPGHLLFSSVVLQLSKINSCKKYQVNAK